VTGCADPEGAKALLDFLSSPEAAPAIVESGLDPIPRGG